MASTHSWLSAAAAVLLALAACTSQSDEPPRAIDAAPPADAAPGVWQLHLDEQLTPSTTEFDVWVFAAACNSGVTGEAYEPAIDYSESIVSVSFMVAPLLPGEARFCKTNEAVPFTVKLDEPLGNRALVDGQCLEPDPAATCDPADWSN